MALQYLPISIILALVVLIFRLVNGDVYFVAPDVADCKISTSCNTLSYYASSTTQQLSDSVFYFMSGTHLLQRTWVINNASNLTLSGRSPNSEASQKVIIECTDSSTDRGIRVINGSNIALGYMAIFHCQQGADGALLLSSALLCDSTNNLELSKMTMKFSPESCLNLINCTEYVITDSVFANNGYAFFIQGPSSGNVTSIELINNTYGIYACDDTPNLITIILARINAYNNVQFDFSFFLCSADISLRQSLSDHSGGFAAQQACLFSELYTIDIQKCNFTAMEQGFVIFLLQAQIIDVNIISCVFSNTSENASYPGIVIEHVPLRAEKDGSVGNFTIKDVTMENIHVPGNLYPVLRLSNIEQVIIINLSILNNGHGGLVLDDSVAVFRGANTFTNNSGTYGGGMALYGSSYVSFVDSSDSMELINNKAEKFGGGIFVSQLETWTDFYWCFMQLDDQFPRVSFQGNTAGYAGSQLYGGSIDTCWQAQSDLKLNEVLGYLTNTTQCNQTDISSDAMNLTLCDQYCINTTRTVKTVRTYPGASLSISIAAIGQLEGLTRATVLLTYEEVFDNDQVDESQFINAGCANISRNIRTKRTNTSGNITLTLSDDFISLSANKPIITLVVDLLPCPPGFNFSEVNKICVCSDSIKHYAECDITTQSITRNDASWIFPTKESIMIFEHCPFDYCNTEPFSVDNPDGQCENSRSWILCGDCIRGYSLTLGSNTCLNCTHQLWNLPIILLGSTLAGIVLVAVLVVLNLTVSMGTINGLLFFVNVVKIYEPIFFHYNHSKLLQYLFSWLNLDIGITTCFYEGMDACQKVGLQFVFPMYLLLLVMAIVAVCRCGQWIGLRSLPWVVKLSDKTVLLMGSKIIPVLATLLLFSYTKLIRSTILIYNKAVIQVFESNTIITDIHYYKSMWYVNGSVEYLTGCHGVLFGLGTGIIVPLISLFTAFLLFFPLMERYLPRFKFWSSWHMRLKPWYDAYGGPYKDEYRFWTGLLLLVRCLVAVVVTVIDDPNIASSVLTWLCLILIPTVALLQVYKSSFLNVLEIIYLSSILASIVLSTIYQSSVQFFMVLSIALCLLFAILLFHAGQQLRLIWIALMDMRRSQVHSDEENEDYVNKVVPIGTIKFVPFTELRESLLSDNN